MTENADISKQSLNTRCGLSTIHSSAQKGPMHFEKEENVFWNEYIYYWVKQIIFRITFTLLFQLFLLYFLVFVIAFISSLSSLYSLFLFINISSMYIHWTGVHFYPCYRFINSKARSSSWCFCTCTQFFSPSWKWAGLSSSYALNFCSATASGREPSAIHSVGKWRQDPLLHAGSFFRWWRHGPWRWNRRPPWFCTWN